MTNQVTSKESINVSRETNLEKNLFSFGNSKLPKTTAIFNMSSATTCESDFLGLCKVSVKCYAKKAERIYKQVKPYRDNQENFWKSCSSEEFVTRLLSEKKSKKVNLLRLNESGDLRSLDCLIKVFEISELLKKFSIKVYIYTHRIDILKSIPVDMIPENLNIMLSNGKLDGYGSFIGVKSLPVNSDRLTCIGDCKVCNLCSYTKETILVKIH